MKFDEFFGIWTKFLSAFNNAKHDLEKSEQPPYNMNTLRRPGLSYEFNTLSSTKTTNRNLNTNKPAVSSVITRTVNIEQMGSNTFDKLCTEVRQCKYLPTSSSPPNGSKSTLWSPNRAKIRSINDFNLPNCRSSSES